MPAPGAGLTGAGLIWPRAGKAGPPLRAGHAISGG